MNRDANSVGLSDRWDTLKPLLQRRLVGVTEGMSWGRYEGIVKEQPD